MILQEYIPLELWRWSCWCSKQFPFFKQILWRPAQSSDLTNQRIKICEIVDLWHRRLGHCPNEWIRKTIPYSAGLDELHSHQYDPHKKWAVAEGPGGVIYQFLNDTSTISHGRVGTWWAILVQQLRKMHAMWCTKSASKWLCTCNCTERRRIKLSSDTDQISNRNSEHARSEFTYR